MASLTADQLDALRRFAGVAADADAATTVAGVLDALDEYRDELGDEEWQRRINTAAARHRTSSAAPMQPATPTRAVAGFLGPDAPCDSHEIDQVLAWGVGTGRFTSARADFWRAEAADEQARTGSTLATEAAVRALRPLYYEADRPTASAGSASVSDTPQLDAIDRALFGPSQAERERAQDLAAEAELRAQLDAEATEQARADRETQLLAQHRQATERLQRQLEENGA